MRPARARVPGAAWLLLAAGAASAQQVVKPPQAQAWIDVATYSGFGMPGAGAAGGSSPSALSMLGNLLGNATGLQANHFGNTQTGGAGRWVDVTLYSRANPSLGEAQQAVPAGFLSPALKLQAPRQVSGPPPEPTDESVEQRDYERPKGRLLIYWGCGASIRPGQPKVLDMATLSAADMAKFFVTRRATQRGTHSAAGRPVWPSVDDTRLIPAQASLVGEHAFSGAGVPEGFRFQIPPAQDLMPALQVQQQASPDGATTLSWANLPTARAYFLSGIGSSAQSAGQGTQEVVFWTSAELPETGFGLMDYQTNAAVDKWLKEKALLPAGSTQCTVPAGVFAPQGAMLRAIAYGSELNLAYPPRPANPKEAWEPVWAAKVRVKSQTGLMLGMEMPTMPGAASPTEEPAPDAKPEKKNKAMDLLKGILGR